MKAEHVAVAFAGGVLALLVYEVRAWRQDLQTLSRLLNAGDRERPKLSSKPRVSVLVAAWNERELLRRHVCSVLNVNYPDLEYVLCAGGDDGTYQIARELEQPNVTILEQHGGEGKLAALRRCLQHASGEIIMLTDADSTIDAEAFECLMAPLINEGAAAATGRFVPLPEQSSLDAVRHQWAVATYASAHASPDSDTLAGANAAVRRDVLDRVGGLSEDAQIGEDYELARRLLLNGYSIRFVFRSRVRTQFTPSYFEHFRRQARWLNTVLLFGVQFRAWSQVLAVAQAYVGGVAAVLLPLAALVVGRAMLALWLIGLLYAILNRVRYLRFGSVLDDIPVGLRTYLKSIIYAPLDLLMLVYAVGEALWPGRRHRW